MLLLLLLLLLLYYYYVKILGLLLSTVVVDSVLTSALFTPTEIIRTTILLAKVLLSVSRDWILE